jgi:hypothetical protein
MAEFLQARVSRGMTADLGVDISLPDLDVLTSAILSEDDSPGSVDSGALDESIPEVAELRDILKSQLP